ncbi:hypothetical protein ACIGDI_22915 [Streptomyces sp. NPDC085900]
MYTVCPQSYTASDGEWGCENHSP